LEFEFEILQFYLLKCFTSNCQVKCDSVVKHSANESVQFQLIIPSGCLENSKKL